MTQAEELARPFPRALVQRQQGKDYVAVSEYIVRLNQVLGVGAWSSDADAHRDGDWVIARVRLTAKIDGQLCEATQYGGHKQQTDKNDLGDTYKSAVSDAFKKACQQLGVALYLARTDEAKRLVPQSLAGTPLSAGQQGEGGGESTAKRDTPSGAAPPPKPTLGALKADMEALKKAGLDAHPSRD